MRKEKENVKENNGCGFCIECLLKCPECGSTDVSVYFTPTIEYNHIGDYVRKDGRLSIDCTEESISIYCIRCDSEFSGNKNSKEKGYDFYNLIEVLKSMLELYDSYEFERKKACESEPFSSEWEISSYRNW